MDMWRPYVDATARWLPNAAVCFDRFHVAKHLCDLMNTVRKKEHRQLRAEGDRTLVGTKHLRLENSGSMRPERRSLLWKLKGMCTRTAHAWALRAMASRLWDYAIAAWARKAWLGGKSRSSRLSGCLSGTHLVEPSTCDGSRAIATFRVLPAGGRDCGWIRAINHPLNC